MRVFYVAYVTDPVIRQCINAIRFICNPNDKDAAHITVRGPYRQRYHLRAINERISGVRVDIRGIGRFFEGHQNTVFFTVDAPSLESVWYKPQYPDFNPHITIYDGKSREFAEQLLIIIERYEYNLSFNVECLEPLISVKGQSNTNLRADFPVELVSDITGRHIAPNAVEHLSFPERLEMIDQICSFLSNHWAPSRTGEGKSLVRIALLNNEYSRCVSRKLEDAASKDRNKTAAI